MKYIRKRSHVKTETRYLFLVVALILLVFFVRSRLISENGDPVEELWKKSPLWVEDQKPHLNPHKYRYILNEPDFCGNDNVDLLVLVSSSISHREQREAIRATWANKESLSTLHTKVVFLLGQSPDGSQAEIAEESSRTKDILQEDFHDSYRNLTLKTVMGLKWSAIFCPQAKFVMKTDDDIFVNLDLLLKALHEESSHFEKISGCIKNGPQSAFQPIPAYSNDVLFDPSKLPPAHPAFVAGAGYVLPGSAVQQLYVASLATRMFPVEDVYTTAHCARRIGLHPPRHDGRFSCGQMVLEECEMSKMFTGHKVNPDMMFGIVEALEKGNCEQILEERRKRIENGLE